MNRANGKVWMFIHAMSIAAGIILIINGLRQVVQYGYQGYADSVVFILGIVVGVIGILAALLRLATNAKK